VSFSFSGKARSISEEADRRKEIVFPRGKRHRSTGHELITTAAALIDHAVPVRTSAVHTPPRVPGE
jgi:hypothetical protein